MVRLPASAPVSFFIVMHTTENVHANSLGLTRERASPPNSAASNSFGLGGSSRHVFPRGCPAVWKVASEASNRSFSAAFLGIMSWLIAQVYRPDDGTATPVLANSTKENRLRKQRGWNHRGSFGRVSPYKSASHPDQHAGARHRCTRAVRSPSPCHFRRSPESYAPRSV